MSLLNAPTSRDDDNSRFQVFSLACPILGKTEGVLTEMGQVLAPALATASAPVLAPALASASVYVSGVGLENA